MVGGMTIIRKDSIYEGITNVSQVLTIRGRFDLSPNAGMQKHEVGFCQMPESPLKGSQTWTDLSEAAGAERVPSLRLLGT